MLILPARARTLALTIEALALAVDMSLSIVLNSYNSVAVGGS